MHVQTWLISLLKGKTSLTTQYIAPPTYNEQYFPTIESTSHKTVSLEGVEYDCEIIDSAGQVSDTPQCLPEQADHLG